MPDVEAMKAEKHAKKAVALFTWSRKFQEIARRNKYQPIGSWTFTVSNPWTEITWRIRFSAQKHSVVCLTFTLGCYYRDRHENRRPFFSEENRRLAISRNAAWFGFLLELCIKRRRFGRLAHWNGEARRLGNLDQSVVINSCLVCGGWSVLLQKATTSTKGDGFHPDHQYSSDQLG